ncbi:MAG: hypothetical protein M1825_000802 [Sarcosagium campestre]|nr:MAG: hypothetical protein M1825_000802 [Sarcosagium campestre]
MRFPWSSEPIRSVGTDRKVVGIMAPPQARPSPVIEIPVFSRFKRKSDDLNGTTPPRPDKRSKPRNTSKPKTQRPKARKHDAEGAMIERQLRNEERSSVEMEDPSQSTDLARSHQAAPALSPRTYPAGRGREKRYSDSPAGDLSPFTLREIIDAQFGFEILLKHKELRLIEQELAKCQVSLEQLRRCRLITPAEGGSEASSLGKLADLDIQDADNTSANGSWLAAPAVSNGPYTRHYAKWLIPDQRFDGDDASLGNLTGNAMAGKYISEGRSTRGHLVDISPAANKGRLRGTGTGSKLQALSNGFSHAKEKGGPLIVKRSSDEQWVKLVCIDCDRGDFSSAQGFINHCRIAHHRGFESHDAAAIACGQIVDIDETKPVPTDTEVNNTPTSLVHPFIRSAPTTHKSAAAHTVNAANEVAVKTKPPQPLAPKNPRHESAALRAAKKNPRSKALAKVVLPDFVPSPQAPHLSALMKQRGVGCDLGDMVGQAKERFDLGVYGESSDEGSSDEEQQTTPSDGARALQNGGGGAIHRVQHQHQRTPLSGGRVPARSTMSPAPLNRPNSAKGLDKHGSHAQRRLGGISPCPAPTTTTSSSPSSSSSSSAASYPTVITVADSNDNTPSPPHLSPQLLDPASAPSLVSDDEDDEYEVRSESETPSSVSAPENEDMIVDFDVEDGSDSAPASSAAAAAAAADPDLAAASRAVKPAGPPRRRTALRSRGDAANANAAATATTNNNVATSAATRPQRHVSFASPVSVRRPSARGRGAVGRRRASSRH